jgi:hypothetical protein
METVFRNESPVEYFKELVEAALVHQRIDANQMTAYYVVNLLAGFVSVNRSLASGMEVMKVDEPLALRLARALDSGGARQRAQLRQVGDLSLFISGFFSDSLNRKLVDIDYYMSLGGYAYGSLSRQEDDSFSLVFAELARKFAAFVDVLNEVSERSGTANPNADLLRLYEKWLRTGSQRSGQRLVERGIVPNASIGTRFIQ